MTGSAALCKAVTGGTGPYGDWGAAAGKIVIKDYVIGATPIKDIDCSSEDICRLVL